MCGICGIIAAQPLTGHDVAQVALMSEAMVHRGPDGAGACEASHLALAVRRLSIIDLNSGWQPLYNENRSLALVANGEIYNFVELRAALEARGHRFATGSDCECILHLYEECGEACVDHLRGMFAFALWDAPRRRLFIARDRMGEKPLYLYDQPGRLLFASELRALLSSGAVPFALDLGALDLYFHYGYVPEPRTPIYGVRKLDAGHCLSVELEPWRVSERCYWRMEDAPPLAGDPAALIGAELDAISRMIVRSDVPVGVALSGGLDSSAIATLAHRAYPGTMRAFSVGYADATATDERAEARALAARLDLPFHDVELATSDMVAAFRDLVDWRDDPIADISGYGYYAVMRLAREHGVPVMLMGHGGDELFWGYGWTQQAAHESLQKAEQQRRGLLALPYYLQLEPPSGRDPQALLRWLRGAAGLRRGLGRYRRHSATPADRLVMYDLVHDFQLASAHAAALYGPALVAQREADAATRLFSRPQPWRQVGVAITRLISDTYLRENGIAQGDRLSMASSVELRLPLVDYRLVELVIGLRKAAPDHGLEPKAWLKQAMRGLLPEEMLHRPKRGFTPPVAQWYARLFAAYGAELDGGMLVEQGVLSAEGARALCAWPLPDQRLAGLAFKALVLEYWCQAMRALCARPVPA